MESLRTLLRGQYFIPAPRIFHIWFQPASPSWYCCSLSSLGWVSFMLSYISSNVTTASVSSVCQALTSMFWVHPILVQLTLTIFFFTNKKKFCINQSASTQLIQKIQITFLVHFHCISIGLLIAAWAHSNTAGRVAIQLNWAPKCRYHSGVSNSFLNNWTLLRESSLSSMINSGFSPCVSSL